MHPFEHATLFRLRKCFSRIYMKVIEPVEIPCLTLFAQETKMRIGDFDTSSILGYHGASLDSPCGCAAGGCTH